MFLAPGILSGAILFAVIDSTEVCENRAKPSGGGGADICSSGWDNFMVE